MATPDEIRESELGKAKSLGCCLRRSPSTDVWAADYGCFLVYETLDCSGESRRFENLDQVEDFLVKREQSGAMRCCKVASIPDDDPSITS